MKNQNESIKILIKKQLNTTKKKEKNYTIETKYDKDGNKVSMFETVKEVDEEKMTKQHITSA